MRVQAQGRLIGEHSRVLRRFRPIPADDVRAALVSLQGDLGNRQQKLLSSAFEAAQSTVNKAEAAGGVPQGFSKNHYVPGVRGSDARVDIESKAGNGNIGPGGGGGRGGVGPLFSNEHTTIKTNDDGSRTAVISSTGSRLTREIDLKD